MRSAYSAVFLCALACASVPSTARLSSTGTAAPTAATVVSSGGTASSHGQLLTGTNRVDYFGGETLYDVLRLRAPIYLRPRPNPSLELTGRADPLAVYIDGSFAGTIDVLQLLPAHEVASVNRISAVESVTRYGTKHNNGALLVTMVRHD